MPTHLAAVVDPLITIRLTQPYFNMFINYWQVRGTHTARLPARPPARRLPAVSAVAPAHVCVRAGTRCASPEENRLRLCVHSCAPAPPTQPLTACLACCAALQNGTADMTRQLCTLAWCVKRKFVSDFEPEVFWDVDTRTVYVQPQPLGQWYRLAQVRWEGCCWGLPLLGAAAAALAAAGRGDACLQPRPLVCRPDPLHLRPTPHPAPRTAALSADAEGGQRPRVLWRVRWHAAAAAPPTAAPPAVPAPPAPPPAAPQAPAPPAAAAAVEGGRQVAGTFALKTLEALQACAVRRRPPHCYVPSVLFAVTYCPPMPPITLSTICHQRRLLARFVRANTHTASLQTPQI